MRKILIIFAALFLGLNLAVATASQSPELKLAGDPHRGEYQKAPDPGEKKSDQSIFSYVDKFRSKFYESEYKCVENTLVGSQKYMAFGFFIKEVKSNEACAEGSYCITPLPDKPTPSGNAECLKADKLFDDYKECAGPTMKKLKVGIGGVVHYLDVPCSKDLKCVYGECVVASAVYCNDDDDSNYGKLIQGVMDESVTKSGSVEYGVYGRVLKKHKDVCKNKTSLEEYACYDFELRTVGIDCYDQFKDSVDPTKGATCAKDNEGRGYCDISQITLSDKDKDGDPDFLDNCPEIANDDQADFNGDGIGDACIVTFSKTYGGKYNDGAFSIIKTADGGYAVGGDAELFSEKSFSASILRLDMYGDVLWMKTYDAIGLGSISATKDGGFVIMGGVGAPKDEVFNMWIQRIDPFGTVMWKKIIQEVIVLNTFSVEETNNGDFIIAGMTNNPWELPSSSGMVLLYKLDPNGNLKWSKYFSPEINCDLSFALLLETSVGDYLVSGVISNCKEFKSTENRTFIIRLNKDGEMVWNNDYIMDEESFGAVRVLSLKETKDGGFIATGAVHSGKFYYDPIVIKLDSLGEIKWQKQINNYSYNAGNEVQETSDGGFIIAGNSTSKYDPEDSDAWIIKLGQTGDIIWQKTYGGSKKDYAWDIKETDDGGYIVAGATDSFGSGQADMWILKMTKDGIIYEGCPLTLGVDTTANAVNGTVQVTDRYFNSGSHEAYFADSEYYFANANPDVTVQCENVK